MIESLYDLEVQILLALNDWGGSATDTFFYYASEKWYSLPLHMVLLIVLFKNFGWKKTLFSLVMIALMITISDQLAELFKDILVKRPRPCSPDALGDQVSMIGKRCGTFGFYSAHASSSLALAVYLGLLFKPVYKKLFIILLIWAAIVSYSRIYLGVHYPSDTLAGWIAGGAIGFSIFKLHQKIALRIFP